MTQIKTDEHRLFINFNLLICAHLSDLSHLRAILLIYN